MRRQSAFTLAEMIVSVAIVLLLTTVLIAALSQMGAMTRRVSGKVEQFREATNAFESLTTRLSQATLDAHLEYDNPAKPTKYRRESSLRFCSGRTKDLLGDPPAGCLQPTHGVFFQGPFGESEVAAHRGYENLLCTWGYFLEVGDERPMLPTFLSEIIESRFRPRLYEFRQLTESNLIYKYTAGALAATYAGKDWFRIPLAQPPRPARPIAENIVALIITPRLSPVDEREVKGGAIADVDSSPLAPAYAYDSSPVSAANPGDSRHKDGRLNPVHQLPPMLQVTMVAVDDMGSQKLEYDAGQLDPLNLDAKFKDSRQFSKEMLLSGDETSVENELIKRRINYRIFTTNVVIRGAKWSREQTEKY